MDPGFAIGSWTFGSWKGLGSSRMVRLLASAALLASTVTLQAPVHAHAAVAAPAVYAVNPNSGPTQGGTTVTIYGVGFTGATDVKFGNSTANCSGFGFFVLSDTQIFAASPSNSAGIVDVVVVGPGGSSSTGPADKFTYVNPSIPIVFGISPNSGTTAGGTFVSINGSGFASASAVMFGSTPIRVFPFSDTNLFVNSPAGALGTVDITVVNPAGSSAPGNADKFTYVAPGGPVVQGLSPNHGTAAGGTQVAILGSGFTGATAVHFGTTTVALGAFGVADDSHIIVPSPPGPPATIVDVTVTAGTNTSGTSNADRFSYEAVTVPIVRGVLVNRGPTTGATQVQLFGSGFSGATDVKFGANSGAGVSGLDDNHLVATSPAGSVGTVHITVTTPVGSSSPTAADQFTYVALSAPAVYGIAPHSGITTGNTYVTIYGSGFVQGSTVKFGANVGTNVFTSDTSISVQSPAGSAGTVDITVTNPAGTSAAGIADRFTYASPGIPAVRVVNPNRGFAVGGTGVTLAGSGFTGATAVHFGAVLASGLFVFNDNQLAVTSPPGTSGTTVDITVTTPVATSAMTAADLFSYFTPVVPTITAVSPSTGPASGGTTVWISGTALSGVSSVRFGTTPTFNFQPTSDTVIEVLASPQGTNGAIVDITVVTPGGTSATSAADQFTFGAPVAPAITVVSPSTGPASGGTKVYISGSGFAGATGVNFGATPATSFSVYIDGSLITANSPAGTVSTTVDIRVVGPGGTSPVTVNDQFTYSAGVPPPPPAISAVSPNTGPAAGGTTVYVSGSNLLSTTQVKFGAVMASYFVNDDNLITATSPSGTAGATVDVVVTAAGGMSAVSSADKFTYGAAVAPAVTGVSPSTGPAGGGTTIYVTGSGFTGLTGITFGATASIGAFAWSDTLAQTTSPAGAGTVHVTVTTGAGTSAPTAIDQFTYGGPPPAGLQVNGVNPNSGPTAGGTSVQIYGLGFAGATAVKFGTVAAQNIFVSGDTQIFVTSPAGSAGRVDITVTVGANTSSTNNVDGFTYKAPTQPVVNALLPNHGSQTGGTSVQIYGTGFTGATAVHFGSKAATNVFAFSDTGMTATSPPGAVGAVDVTVTGPLGTSVANAADTFTYVVAGLPAINAVDPASGTSLGGTSVVLYGNGFTGVTAVAFGSTPASSFYLANDTQIFITSPPGTAGTTVDIKVTTPVGTSVISNADKYAFLAPTIPVVRAVSPNRGGTNGGNRVLLFGSGFSGATAVHFGATLSTNIAGVADSMMQVTTPPGALGTVDVTVTTPGGVSLTSAADKFTYYAASVPTITAVSPNTGPAGTTVYLTGTGFSDVTGVLFGSVCVQFFFGNFFSDTSLTVTAPAGPAGTVDVTVISPEGTSAITVNDQFTYTAPSAPSVTGVAPASGPSAGGTTVFITGSGLSGVTGVTFGTTPAIAPARSVPQAAAISGAFSPIDDSLIAVRSPAGTSGTTIDIRVTTPGGTSATSPADQFAWGPTQAPSMIVVSPSSGPSGGGAELLVTGSGFSDATHMNFGNTALNPCAFGPVFRSDGGDPTVKQTSRLPSVRLPVAMQLPVHQSATARDTGKSPAFVTVLVPSEPQVLNSAVPTRSPNQVPMPQAFGRLVCPPGYFYAFSDNLIDVTSPAQGTNPATVDVTVTSAGGTSTTTPGDQYTFTATPMPAVSAVAPSSGRSAGGATVYISGSNLTNPSSVHFGTAAATIIPLYYYSSLLSGDSLIQVLSPPGLNPSTVDVTVTTAGGTSPSSANDKYTYGSTPAPTIGVVSPSSGPIGTTVFITGTNLNGTTAVNFGGTPAIPNPGSNPPAVNAAAVIPGFSVMSDTLIRAMSPTHALGVVDVTVVTGGGTSAISANDHYTYTASPTPVVTIIGPSSGTPGTTVNINGTGLTAASAVTFGATNATSFAVLSDTLIQAISPAGTGTVDVRVTTPGGLSATSSNDRWTFGTGPPSPTVISVVPNTGPAAGGTSVTITGTNFTGATAVRFGVTAAATFTVNNAASITATSPAGAGTVDVTVTTPGGTSPVSIGDKFTFGTPTAPIGVQAVAGDTEATLTWTPPLSGAPITTYTATASPGGATTTVSALVPAATVTGLTNGTPYTFTVVATNAIGTGPASLPSAAVTPTAVAKGPSVAVLPAMSNGAYGGYLTTAYLENLGASAAHVRVQYFDTSGLGVGSGNSVAGLAAGGTWTLRTDNGDSLAATQPGSAVVYSDQPLGVFVNEFAPGGTDATSYTAISVPSGTGGTLFAPAIANNAYGGYTTGIGLINLSSSAVNITVTYRDGTGAVAKTQNLNSVAGGAYVPLYSGDPVLGLADGFAGTATITSSGGNLAAVVNETGPGFQFSSYDAVPTGSTTLYAPVALNNAFGGYNTGMGIQNTTGSAGTVTISYYDTTGLAATTTFPIVANGYIGVYQGTDIPAAGAYTAKITSSVAIAAIVNEVAPSATSFKQSTAYNTFVAGSSSLHLPLVESSGADGWSTGEGIMNTGSAATTVTVTYYDTVTGLTFGTPQSLLLQPSAFWGLYQPAGGLPTGARASAVVTTTAGGQVAVICNESNATSFMSYTGI